MATPPFVGRLLDIDLDGDRRIGLCIGRRNNYFANGPDGMLVWFPQPEGANEIGVCYVLNMYREDWRYAQINPAWMQAPAGLNPNEAVGTRISRTWRRRRQNNGPDIIDAHEGYIVGYTNQVDRYRVLFTRRGGCFRHVPNLRLPPEQEGNDHDAGHRWRVLPMDPQHHIPGLITFTRFANWPQQ